MDPSAAKAEDGANDGDLTNITVEGGRRDMELDTGENVEDDEADLIGEPDTGFGEAGESYSDEWRTAREEATSLEH